MPVLTKINTNSIAEDAITGDKFAGDAYLSNTTNQNISGTYSENRLYTSDAYTLSGNATVNSNLTLSSVKPTADVVLTAGGAYTITGTGVLSAGTLLAKANTDLTGMTGALGSAVTGSPNLNLGNVTFPAGHIVKTSPQTTGNTRTDINVGNNTMTDTVVTASFTPTYNNSDVIVHVWYTTLIDNTGGDAGIMTRFKRAISGGATTYPASLAVAENTSSNGTAYMHIGGATVAYTENYSTWHSLIDSPATTSAITYPASLAVAEATSSNGTRYMHIGGATVAFNWNDSTWHSLIDSPMTTSEITYTLQCAEYNCESVYIGAGNGIGSRWHIWFQEVKR